MLKGVDPLLNGDLLKILDEMGHGDQLLVVDRNRRYQLAAEVTPEDTVEPERIQNGSKMDPQVRLE